MRINLTHQERHEVRTRVQAITAAHEFDQSGVCMDTGKLWGCYEATVYFNDLSLEGVHGEGIISYADGSSEVAFKVSALERAMLAGPWDGEGKSVWDIHPDLLYVICEDAQGLVTSSFNTPADWADRQGGYEIAED
jgi:hypothetical protein